MPPRIHSRIRNASDRRRSLRRHPFRNGPRSQIPFSSCASAAGFRAEPAARNPFRSNQTTVDSVFRMKSSSRAFTGCAPRERSRTYLYITEFSRAEQGLGCGPGGSALPGARRGVSLLCRAPLLLQRRVGGRRKELVADPVHQGAVLVCLTSHGQPLRVGRERSPSLFAIGHVLVGDYVGESVR